MDVLRRLCVADHQAVVHLLDVSRILLAVCHPGAPRALPQLAANAKYRAVVPQVVMKIAAVLKAVVPQAVVHFLDLDA